MATEEDVLYSADANENRFASTETQVLLRKLAHQFDDDLISITRFVSVAAGPASHEVKIALSGVLQYIDEIALVRTALHVPVIRGEVDGAHYLRNLCRSISRAKLQHRSITLSLMECPVSMHPEKWWRVGIIVFQLVNAAAGHDFGGSAGHIRVEMATTGSRFACSVVDNGLGTGDANESRSVEIAESIAGLLDGNLDYICGRKGTIASLSFSLLTDDISRSVQPRV